MSRNEKIFWTILAVLVSAVLCVGGYKLYKQLDSFKTEVATDKAERAACLAREQVLSVAEANLSRDLAAKTKAYDQKKAYWCPLYGLPEGEAKTALLTKQKEFEQVFDEKVEDILTVVRMASILGSFPEVEAVDREFSGYDLLPVTGQIMEEWHSTCAEDCSGVDYTGTKEKARELYVPMTLPFWVLYVLHNFNALDFSNKENPPNLGYFLFGGYGGFDGEMLWEDNGPNRAKLLKVLENPEHVATYGAWFVNFVRTGKPFVGSAGRGAKMWLADAWKGTWAPFAQIQKDLTANPDLLPSGEWTPENSVYTVFDGWFYRRWANTGGKKGGDKIIEVYREFLIDLADALGMPTYVAEWRKQMQAGKGSPADEDKADAEDTDDAEEDEDEDARDTEASDEESGDGDEEEAE